MRTSLLVFVAAATAACGEEYIYTPESANAVASNGVPAEKVSIPQERPEGSVEITSYGVARLRGDNDTKIPALHVRLSVSNDGDAVPWQLDTRQQVVDITGAGKLHALYASAGTEPMPVLSIPRGQKISVDLYFPLPEALQHAKNLPHFDVLWQVTTPLRVVASRTSFQRQEPLDYYYADVWPYWSGYGWGYGPYWWYDPFYPNYVFIHQRPTHVGQGVIGTR